MEGGWCSQHAANASSICGCVACCILVSTQVHNGPCSEQQSWMPNASPDLPSFPCSEAMASDFEVELLPLLHKHPQALGHVAHAWTLERFK